MSKYEDTVPERSDESKQESINPSDIGAAAVRSTVTDSRAESGEASAARWFDIAQVDPNEPGQEDFTNLGEELVYLRARANNLRVSNKKQPLDSANMNEILRSQGYVLPKGGYDVLEQSAELPKHPEKFFDLICEALGVEITSKYWALLRAQYLYDHACHYVDREFADKRIEHGSAYLKALRNKRR